MTKIKKVPDIIDKTHGFCAGCSHGVFYRIIQECLEELHYENSHITVIGVGCSCNLNALTNGDIFQCAHGRAAAVATGMKRVRPEPLIFTYQGDGDSNVIGLAETLNAAYRNEKITVFTVNNVNFGMTGGQMSWTTLSEQKTSTSPRGRDCTKTGFPIKIPEIIASQFDVAYVARCSVHDVKALNHTKACVKNALESQINGEGYSMVELLGICPTNFGLDPVQSMEFLKEEMIPQFPLGEFKKRG